jgi:tetratricopeptide (TPR) repeat protein
MSLIHVRRFGPYICLGGLLFVNGPIVPLTTNRMMVQVSHYIWEAGVPPLGAIELVKPVPRRSNSSLKAAKGILSSLSKEIPATRNYSKLAAVSLLAGDTQQAELALRSLDDQNSAAFLRACLYSQRGSARLTSEALRSSPEFSRTLVLLGIRQSEAGRLAEALALTKMAEGIDGLASLNFAYAHAAYSILSLGAISVDRDHSESVCWAERWLQALPNDSEGYYRLASLYTLWRTEPEKARQVLSKIEELRFHQDYRYPYYWGMVCRAEGDLGRAAVFLNKGFQMRPSDPYLAWQLGDTLFRLGRYKEAAMPLGKVASSAIPDSRLQERASRMLREIVDKRLSSQPEEADTQGR